MVSLQTLKALVSCSLESTTDEKCKDRLTLIALYTTSFIF